MKYFIILFLMLVGNSSYSQHTVNLKTGEKLDGELQSISGTKVSFFHKGSLLSFDIGQISSIQFDTGVKTTGSQSTASGSKGVSFVMPGRKITKQPKVDNLTMEKGIVVIAITINKYGDVIKADPGAEGTTTMSQYLLTKGKQAAESTKFDGGTTMPLEQKGTITVTF